MRNEKTQNDYEDAQKAPLTPIPSDSMYFRNVKIFSA